MNIPTEAIEAAGEFLPPVWTSNEVYRAQLIQALEAAAPFMLRAVAEDARADLAEIISRSFYNEHQDPSGHTADAILAAGYRKVTK